MYDFLADLDEYFCEKYANYDKLCVLEGYKMPVMHATRLDEFGRSYAYTLPAETMRLANQEKKTELLEKLKPRLVDKTFSFSFEPVGLFARLKSKFSKAAVYKVLGGILQKYGVSKEEALTGLTVSESIWKGVCKGRCLPSKNLLLSLALTAQLSWEDCKTLLTLRGESLDFTLPKDVVVSYLLTNKVYNGEMIKEALKAYNVENLYIKNA